MTDLSAILPEIFMTILGCALIVADLYIEKKETVGIFAIIGLTISFFINVSLWNTNMSVFSNMFIVDNYSIFLKGTFIITGIFVSLISLNYLKIEGINLGEYYVLVVFAVLGMMIMAGGGDMITIYLGLELLALSSYALVGFNKTEDRSIEASLKYFLTGAFTSGILLYGIALLYGMTGSTNIKDIAAYIAANNIAGNPVLTLALIMLCAGFGFKITAAPFHVWAPDVYEGAPTSITAFLSVGSKFAGFAALIRVFIVTAASLKPHWTIILSVFAVLTMTIGNITAVYQNNIKRMLAYSSIAHAGYVLIGVVAASSLGVASVLFYSIVYAFMNIGAFCVLILMNKKGDRGEDIENFRGMASTNPVIAVILTVFFVSLAGIPPTAGFAGKFYIFSAAINSGIVWLAVIGVLNSVIAVYYYLRVVMIMFMEDNKKQHQFSFSTPLMIALSILVVAVVVFGIYPQPLIEVAKASVLL